MHRSNRVGRAALTYAVPAGARRCGAVRLAGATYAGACRGQRCIWSQLLARRRFSSSRSSWDAPSLSSTIADAPSSFSPVGSSNADERRLSAEELARSLVESRKSGTLTTVQLYPGSDTGASPALPLYGSLMPYILDEEARPVVALRPDEKHVQNLAQLDMASLVVYPLTPRSFNPSSFALPRVNLGGRLRKLDPAREDDRVAVLRRQYLLNHPGCKKIIDDLIFYKLEIENAVYCAGGLQDTVHIPFDKYTTTKPDVVMQGSRAIIEWMNEPKRAIYLKLFCQEYAQATDVGEVFMFAVDRKGFEVMAWRQTNRNWVEYRFPFPYEMKSIDDCRGGLWDSCSYLHEKYLKDVEGHEKFDIDTEMKEERERQRKAAEEDLRRRREATEPEF